MIDNYESQVVVVEMVVILEMMSNDSLHGFMCKTACIYLIL